MISFPRGPRQPNASGVVWPDSGTGTPSDVRDIFGPRPFAAHIVPIGYDYDWHRGIDVVAVEGTPLWAPTAGNIIRLSRTNFGWQTAAQLAYWAATGAGATFAREAPASLRIVGDRDGVKAFPATAPQWRATDARAIINGGDWEMRLQVGAAGAIAAGQVGFGLLDATTNEYVAVEWNGALATALGVSAGGALAASGTTLAVTTETWLRCALTGTTISWGVSDDAITWTDIATEVIGAAEFTDNATPVFIPVIYWRSTDVNAATVTVDLTSIGWFDPQTIDRFGNWIEISQANNRALLLHFQDLDVEVGDVVEAGDLVGLAGLTGFDARSGPVLFPHVHLEWIPDSNYTYDNDAPINPLAPGILPRVNVTNNVTVVRTTANDPDAVVCWRLQIQVAREDQNFDVNTITLTGDLATRTLNWNTRAGLNPDNDIPVFDGVYIVPVAFDEFDAVYEVSVYFEKAVVGTTFVSAAVLDTAGTTVWSEP